MRRIAAMVAAILATTACAQEIPFVAGQGSDEKLTDVERGVALRAIEALAAELQVAKEGIRVDTIRAVEWPDSSIGCPEPGRAYLTVVTPGHKVTLRSDGEIYVVHEAKGNAFVCRRTKAQIGLTPALELTFGGQMLAAQKHLAERLGVPTDEVRPTGAVQKTWDDASMGCPEPGVEYPPGEVTGWVLTLRHGMRDYAYHTDMTRTIPCPAITAE